MRARISSPTYPHILSPVIPVRHGPASTVFIETFKASANNRVLEFGRYAYCLKLRDRHDFNSCALFCKKLILKLIAIYSLIVYLPLETLERVDE